VPVTEAENLTLHYLRRLDEKVDRLGVDMREVKERLGNLEHQQAFFERQLAQATTQWAQVSTRIDRIELRLDRIERRLDLISPS
jgi:uncharacterized coiled-coil protein SlyX